MKTNKVFWLALLLLGGLSVGSYLISCQRDTEQIAATPPPVISDENATDRVNCDCLFTVKMTGTDSVQLDICGDICGFDGACTNAATCQLGDKGNTFWFYNGVARTFRLDRDSRRNVCVRHSGPTTTTVNVAVEFGGSTAIAVGLGFSATHCFHANENCNATLDNCL